MAKKKRKPRKPDPNVTAKGMIDQIAAKTEGRELPEPQTTEDEESKKDESAAKRGRKGGLKGGRARAEKLTGRQRSEIARKAARARWRE